MTDKSVAERMHKDFKIVFTSGPDTARLQVSGPISTQDELDAVTAALVVMRDWLPGDIPVSPYDSDRYTDEDRETMLCIQEEDVRGGARDYALEILRNMTTEELDFLISEEEGESNE